MAGEPVKPALPDTLAGWLVQQYGTRLSGVVSS